MLTATGQPCKLEQEKEQEQVQEDQEEQEQKKEPVPDLSYCREKLREQQGEERCLLLPDPSPGSLDYLPRSPTHSHQFWASYPSLTVGPA